MKNLKPFLPYFFAMFSGLLCGMSFPPYAPSALFMCMTFWWLALYDSKTYKTTLKISFITQFITTLVGFYWVMHTATDFGHIPFPLNILVLIIFCSFAHLYFIFSALLSHYLKIKFQLGPKSFFFTMAVTFSAFEFFWPSIFPWNFGYPLLFGHFKTAQLAEFVGFNILSLLVSLFNALFAYSFYLLGQRKRWSKPLFIFLILLTLTEFAGQQTLKKIPKEDQSFAVLGLQTNLESYEKFYLKYGSSYQTPVISELFSTTQLQLNMNKKPNLVIWPETAFPASLDPHLKEGPFQKKLSDFIQKTNTAFVIGAFSEDPKTENKTKEYTGLFAFDRSGQYVDSYRKHILLAFGEYLPGANLFPFIKKLIPETADLTPGDGKKLMTVENVNLTPIICYESLFPDYIAESSNLGSHILLNITNDGWYGPYSEQTQHLTMSIARTIELRKPMVRVTNTGYSAIADVRGQILEKSELNTVWAKTVDVPYYSHPLQTLYSKIYQFLPYFFIALVLLTILGHITKHVKKRT